MAGDPYLRDLRLTVDGAAVSAEISGLYVKFRVRWEASGTPATGDIEVYNLSEGSENRIRDRGKSVELFGGYQGGSLESIAQGDVRRVSRKRVGLDRVAVIRFGGNIDKTQRTVFSRAYQGRVSVRQVVRDVVADMDGIEVGDLRAIPAGAALENRSFALPSRTVLTGLLAPLDLAWYEEGGEISVIARGQSKDDRYDIIISEQSGMVGTPTITDDGVRVRTLLDHRIRMDTRFRVESEYGEASGVDYHVVSYEHSGDNRSGGWFTDIEGRPLDP